LGLSTLRLKASMPGKLFNRIQSRPSPKLETGYGVCPASNQTLPDGPGLGDKLPFGQSPKTRPPWTVPKFQICLIRFLHHKIENFPLTLTPPLHSSMRLPTRTSRNQDVDIQNMLKTPQLVRVQGVFFKKFYPVCVEFYSLVTNNPRPVRYQAGNSVPAKASLRIHSWL
jgi:hypothetical protein